MSQKVIHRRTTTRASACFNDKTSSTAFSSSSCLPAWHRHNHFGHFTCAVRLCAAQHVPAPNNTRLIFSVVKMRFSVISIKSLLILNNMRARARLLHAPVRLRLFFAVSPRACVAFMFICVLNCLTHWNRCSSLPWYGSRVPPFSSCAPRSPPPPPPLLMTSTTAKHRLCCNLSTACLTGVSPTVILKN